MADPIVLELDGAAYRRDGRSWCRTDDHTVAPLATAHRLNALLARVREATEAEQLFRRAVEEARALQRPLRVLITGARAWGDPGPIRRELADLPAASITWTDTNYLGPSKVLDPHPSFENTSMHLHTVTITGADDMTDPAALVRLWEEFPFVEWGILLTARGGRPGFPSADWLHRLGSTAPAGMPLSGHLCNNWAKEVCGGSLPGQLNLGGFGRVQLNVGRHLNWVESPEAIAAILLRGREHILQVGTAREEGLELAARLLELGTTVSILFDSSGGRGISPRTWPPALAEMRCGFAGGLSPDNLAVELRRLSHIVGERSVWIDMQSGVRSSDQKLLDLTKARRCPEISQPFTARNG
jgi:hypothetical protein